MDMIHRRYWYQTSDFLVTFTNFGYFGRKVTAGEQIQNLPYLSHLGISTSTRLGRHRPYMNTNTLGWELRIAVGITRIPYEYM